jgi:hypothetical protein
MVSLHRRLNLENLYVNLLPASWSLPLSIQFTFCYRQLIFPKTQFLLQIIYSASEWNQNAVLKNVTLSNLLISNLKTLPPKIERHILNLYACASGNFPECITLKKKTQHGAISQKTSNFW